MRLADGQPADRIARKIQFQQLPRALAAQIRERSALYDAELPLKKAAITSRLLQKIVARPRSPLRGAFHRRFGLVTWRGRLDALVQNHGDVRAKSELNLRGLFRREQVLGPIEMRAKSHALVGHFSQFGKTEDLVAAGIRKDRAPPRHESVQPAKLANEFVPRPQIQMVG